MGKVFAEIDAALAAFLVAQPLFFVATAPLAADGHVNLSPKGLETFAVLSPTQVAYLDLTGSGIETIAHVRENGRIVLMWCAFDGSPKIIRIHGKARVVWPYEPEFERLRPRLGPAREGERGIVVVTAERIASACGYAVPKLVFVEERAQLELWNERKGPEGIARYQREHNSKSLDGLPGLDPRVLARSRDEPPTE